MLTVLMPSRGRPVQSAEAYDAFLATKLLSDTEMLIILDEDEPEDYGVLPTIRVAHDEPGMGPALNAALAYTGAEIVGFVGDDHRFRTSGWDVMVTEANARMGGGLVYGDDGFQGPNLPTAVFIDSRITTALGWMSLPGATHLYLDNTWLDLGRHLGRLKYLPDMKIEHMHPVVGKGEWDEGHVRVNAQTVYDHDGAIYRSWVGHRRAIDVETARLALR